MVMKEILHGKLGPRFIVVFSELNLELFLMISKTGSDVIDHVDPCGGGLGIGARPDAS